MCYWNNKLDWYFEFDVSAFWLEIANFWGFGVKRGHISIFHLLTPKRHTIEWFCIFWVIMRQNPSRSVFARLVRVTNSHKKLYFTPMTDGPRRRIFTKVRLTACLADIISCYIFGKIGSGVLILQEVRIQNFPIGNWRRRYNSARAACG